MTGQDAQQLRFRYEHAITEARRIRDKAISDAWLQFEKTASEEWNRYIEEAKPWLEQEELDK